jgi:hypothetical protein
MTPSGFRCSGRLLIVLSVVLAVALPGCGASTAPSLKKPQRGMTQEIGGVIEEKAFKETEAELPVYPQEAGLLEFLPRRNSAFHSYIDGQSLSIGEDRVVRYSMLIKSPSGAVNTSYEGLRCKTSEYKVYAFGTDGSQWAKVPDPQWQKIPRLTGDFRFALYKDYYCDVEAIAGRNAKDLIANLKGNPLNNVTDGNR